jgi:hypothetical protein
MPRTMCFRGPRFHGFILVLILFLAAPPAFAAGSREPEGSVLRGVLSELWQALAGWIPLPGAGAGATLSMDGDAHGTMDPNG